MKYTHFTPGVFYRLKSQPDVVVLGTAIWASEEIHPTVVVLWAAKDSGLAAGDLNYDLLGPQDEDGETLTPDDLKPGQIVYYPPWGTDVQWMVLEKSEIPISIKDLAPVNAVFVEYNGSNFEGRFNRSLSFTPKNFKDWEPVEE